MTSKQFLLAGSFLAGLGVALGAVGAHALKDILLEAGRTETFETAVRYQVYHGLALLMVGILWHVFNENRFSLAGILLLTGSILFSGSLYVLCLTSIRWVVYLTPIGGVFMIGGWAVLIIRLLSARK